MAMAGQDASGAHTPVTESLASLEDEDLLLCLQGVLQDRTGVLQAIVDWAVPGLVYIPSKAITEHRICGVIKSFSPRDGYGFITSPEVSEVFGCDVFLHSGQVGDLNVGEEVNFAVLLNKDQKPQAFDVVRGDPTTTPAPGAKGKAVKGQGKEWRSETWTQPVVAPGGKDVGKGWAGKNEGGKAWSNSWGLHPMATKGQPWAAAGAKGWVAEKGVAAWQPEPNWEEWAGPIPQDKGWVKGGKKGLEKGWGKAAPKAGVPPTTSTEMEGVTDRRFEGSIKSFNYKTGFGFIACDELKEQFDVDVFLHHAQIGEFGVGDEVNFSVILNKDHKPQAMDLRTSEAEKRARHG